MPISSGLFPQDRNTALTSKTLRRKDGYSLGIVPEFLVGLGVSWAFSERSNQHVVVHKVAFIFNAIGHPPSSVDIRRFLQVPEAAVKLNGAAKIGGEALLS
jgi:hypothetical protein